MPLKKGTPGEGAKPRSEHFSYTSTEAGGRPWTAWVAAEPYWCLAHPSDEGTKPCLHWMTDGELQCPRCRPARVPPWVGYLACWREADLKPCLIVLREQNSELSENLVYGDYIIISRESGDGNPVSVRRSLTRKTWNSKKKIRQSACDITPSLLTLWKVPVLTQWHEAKFGDNPVSLPPVRRIAVKDDGSVFHPEYQAAAIKAGAQMSSDPIALAEFDRLLASITDRSAHKNGKPKPEGG